MKTDNQLPKNLLNIRGFMISLHQMNDFLPWFGPNSSGVELILDVMAEAKLNTLLFEYEAFFPWRGIDRVISASNAYSEAEILSIQSKAKDLGIEVIPLVQVFGHMAHVLIHEQYKEYAESPDIPHQICPLAHSVGELVCRLIDNTLRLHPGIRFIHLGGDECEQLGRCPKCAEFIKHNGIGKLYSDYMRYATNYVLSKGVVPILWHDMVLQFPECLSAFDERVLFEFWHYGDASHGSMEIPLQTLLKYIPAKRIIGSPGARAEKQHGALHHHPALLEANISEMNLRMAEIGALGTILTDWPDTGCSFFDAFYSIRAQGKAAWTGRELPLSFRHDYARNVFGMDTPELPDKLDSIAGTCAFARGFQYRTCHEVNRFSRASYDFEKEVTAVCKDYEGDGEEELYRLIGRRYAARIFMDWLKDHQRRCQKNHLEFEWYILLAEMTLLFLAVDIGIRKDCFVRRYFPSVSKELVERFQVCEYLNKALMSFDTVKQHYQKFHLPYSMERNLANCCEELFPVALKKGLEDFVDKKTVNQIWSQQ